MSDALDNRKNGGQGKRTAEEFEEVAKPKGKAKAKAKSESKPKAKAQPKSILKKPAAHAAGREYRASLPLAKRVLFRPDGCSKCRSKPGCCPSCF